MTSTINDVASRAGVSITTVSRVLNNNYPVKKETREKIEEAIKALNYTPNIMARSLITKKTSVIGVVVPGITNLFFPTIVESVEKRLKVDGYSISLCNTGGDTEEEHKVVSSMLNRQVDGIIAIDPSQMYLDNGFYEEINSKVPTIIVNGILDTKGNHICYNEEIGTLEAFNYLYNLGHKKIAFIRGEKSYSYDLKEKIYNRFINERKLKYSKVVNLGKGNTLEVVDGSQDILNKLFCDKDVPTAVFACNDLMAVATMNAAVKNGLNVPKDISIIGFDNTIISSITNPKITSVDLNIKDIGKKAAEGILQIVNSKSGSFNNIVYDTKLVIKESCYRVK